MSFTDGSVSDLAYQLSRYQWYYIATTYDGTHKLYVNGQLVAQNRVNKSLIYETMPVYVGANTPSAELFDGIIDEVRIYNRALSDSEIKALYDATK